LFHSKNKNQDALFYNAGCNEQSVVFLNLEKKLAQTRIVVFEKNAKSAIFNSEKFRHRAEG